MSALLTNGTYILNLDSDHYINNSRTFLEAMCFLMDPSNQKICFVQFPQRFEGVDANDRYGSHNTIFYDVSNLTGPLTHYLLKIIFACQMPHITRQRLCSVGMNQSAKCMLLTIYICTVYML